jgi:hypothetical protein
MRTYIIITIILIWALPILADVPDATDDAQAAPAAEEAQVSEVNTAKSAPQRSVKTDSAPSAAAKTAVPQNRVVSPQPGQPEAPSEITVEWHGRPQSSTPQSANQSLIDGAARLSGPYAPQASRKKNLHPHFWKTQTEWIGLRAGVSTYGASFSFSVATLRWKNVYLDIAQFTGGGWKRTVHFFGSTIIGMPFWLSARQEFRVGTGISAGYLRFKKPVDSNSSEFSGSGIWAARVKSYILLPLQASYIFHHQQRLAFELSAMIAFPIYFKNVFLSRQPADADEFDIEYRPFLSIGTGLRF